MDDVAALLARAYIADASGRFAPRYDLTLLQWILGSPGQPPEWHLGARDRENNLVGFISGAPATIRIDGELHPHAVVNLLCVEEAWRSRGVAPLLIEELTRRVVARGITRALFTAAEDVPSRPFASAAYMARLLRPLELVRAGFMEKPMAVSEQDFEKRHAVADPPPAGFRPLTEADLPSASALFAQSTAGVRVAPVYTTEELRHLLLDGPTQAWATTGEEGQITAAAAWYAVPYSIRGGGTIPAASISWLTPTSSTASLLVNLVAACERSGFHVLNCLGVMGLTEELSRLRFLPTSASVSFHLYDDSDESEDGDLRGAAQDVALFPL